MNKTIRINLKQIRKILDFQTYREHYEDNHDNYDVPYLIDEDTGKSKFFLD